MKLWSEENFETKDNCVIYNFKRDISHNGKRYVIKVPLRAGREVLPGNFPVCEKRLKEFKSHLNSEKVIKRYDKILKEYEHNKDN